MFCLSRFGDFRERTAYRAVHLVLSYSDFHTASLSSRLVQLYIQVSVSLALVVLRLGGLLCC